MKYRFIEDNRHRYGVQLLCEVLQVSRSGFYAARCRPPSVRRQRGCADFAYPEYTLPAGRRMGHRASMPSCTRGVPCCRNTVARLMRQAQIVPRSVRWFRVTTDSRSTQASADLVQAAFEEQRLNDCCLRDVTHPTRKVGCTWQPSWICTPGPWSAGQWAAHWARNSSSMLWTWCCGSVVEPADPALDQGCTYSAASYRQLS